MTTTMTMTMIIWKLNANKRLKTGLASRRQATIKQNQPSSVWDYTESPKLALVTLTRRFALLLALF